MDGAPGPELSVVANAVDGVGVEVYDDIAEVVLARIAVHNALNLAMWERLGDVFTDLRNDDRVRAIVLRGAGDRAFSAGADIAEFRERRMGIAAATAYNDRIALTLENIRTTPQPVIAMIVGLAVGGGCEIATVCDVRIAGDDARLGIPINRLGVTLGLTEARALVNLVGPGHARDLLLTGRLIDAEEALRIGLVNRVVPAARLVEETWKTVRRIAAGSPLVARANKLTINALTGGMPAADLELLDDLTTAIYNGADLAEGIAAFLEKREPVFGQRRDDQTREDRP